MTALIWLLTCLPQVLTAVSELPRPVNLILESKHFHHMLTWEPGPGTPAGVQYRVSVANQYQVLSEVVPGCERVRQPLACNLTEAFSKRDQKYFTFVQALLDGRESEKGFVNNNMGFVPQISTLLDLPLPLLTFCGTNLCMDLQPPVEWVRDYYESLKYKLRISVDDLEGEQDLRDPHSLPIEVVEDVVPGRQYCVSIRFSDSDVPRTSNYSEPVCVHLPAHLDTEALIAALLCLAVMLFVVVLALLFSMGYIWQRRRPLPRVLSSFHHLDEEMVASPLGVSLSSLLSLKPTAASAGEKRSSRTSSEEESDEETESRCDSRAGGKYQLWAGASLLSSSSSSSAPAPAPAPAESFSSNQRQSEPGALTAAGLNSDTAADPPGRGTEPNPEEEEEGGDEEQEASQVNLLTLTFGRRHEEEEEEEDSQDVDLLTLTFGRRCEEEEEDGAHVESSSSSSNYLTTNLPTRAQEQEAAGVVRTVSEEEEEEEEEDDCGYRRRH